MVTSKAATTYTCFICNSTSADPNDVEQGYCGRCRAFTRDPLITQWVIYEHPRDFPNSWVLREWLIFSGLQHPVAGNLVVAPNLDGARMFVPVWATNIGRSDTDDPAILEVWL